MAEAQTLEPSPGHKLEFGLEVQLPGHGKIIILELASSLWDLLHKKITETRKNSISVIIYSNFNSHIYFGSPE